MKLLSTEIGDDRIELTYADNPELDDASTLLIVRLPKEIDHSKAIAWNRYWALGDLQEILRGLRDADRDLVEKML